MPEKTTVPDMEEEGAIEATGRSHKIEGALFLMKLEDVGF
jgi:hypothetical protein